MPTSSLRPIRNDQFDYWKAQHLLNRAGFGGTPTQIRALANMGVEKAVDYLVDYRDVEDDAVEATDFDADIMRPPTQAERETRNRARRDGDEVAFEQFRKERQRRQREDRRQMRNIQKWWFNKLIESPRPLQEKMTLFWHGHFATNYRAIEDSYHMFRQNQLLRANATGNFKQLVHGIIRDPAMLRFLNNNQNRRQKPNENLARELMELFTLGEGNDYTEDDIKQGARALTGWTYYDDRFIDLSSRQYQRLHDPDSKRILGQVGNWDGDDFVNIICSRRSCSEFIMLKLYKFLVNDLPEGTTSPTQAVIKNLASEFRSGNYEVRPVLKKLFKSQHFYDEENMASQIKSPIQLIVQAVRSITRESRNPDTLLQSANLMGQNIFYPPTVKGWDGGRSWINTSTMFVRQNVMVFLLYGRQQGSGDRRARGARPLSVMHLVENLRTEDGRINVDEAATYLLRFALGREPHEQRIASLVTFVNDHGGRINNKTLLAMLSLITSMPEFQLC